MQTASCWRPAPTGCSHPSRLPGRALAAWHPSATAASCRPASQAQASWVWTSMVRKNSCRQPAASPAVSYAGKPSGSHKGMCCMGAAQSPRVLCWFFFFLLGIYQSKGIWQQPLPPRSGPVLPPSRLPAAPVLRALLMPLVLVPRWQCPHGSSGAEPLTTGCSSPGTWLQWGSCGQRGHSLGGRGESPGEHLAGSGVPPAPPMAPGVNTKGKINVVLKARQVPGCISATPDLVWGCPGLSSNHDRDQLRLPQGWKG